MLRHARPTPARRVYLLFAAAAALAGCMIGDRSRAGGAPAPGAAEPPPSFVLILTDDQGWAETSVPMLPEVAEAACDYLETPRLERLAREGMRFGFAYAPAPNCTPTRRSLLCGMTPARQRGTEFPSEFAPAEHPTIPTTLKAIDPRYRCAHFGKWGEQMGATPEECGYDESDGPTSVPRGPAGEPGGADAPAPGDRASEDGDNEDGDEEDGDEEDGGPEVPLAAPDPKLTFSVTRRALDFLDRQAKQGGPFYLQVSYYALHRPVQARPETLRKYEGKGPSPRTFPPSFAAMVEDTDAALGAILDRLEQVGLRGRTYVFFAADNGGTEFDRDNPLYAEHARTERMGSGRAAREPGWEEAVPGETVPLPANHPLRGSKQRLYEGGLRVPFVVAGPGVEPGSVCREPVVLYDLLPTMAELAGGPRAAEKHEAWDGASLAPLLANDGRGALVRDEEGLLFHRPRLGYSALRDRSWKLVVGWGRGDEAASLELFDLERDPNERHDLAATETERRDAMYARLRERLAAVNAETRHDFRRD